MRETKVARLVVPSRPKVRACANMSYPGGMA